MVVLTGVASFEVVVVVVVEEEEEKEEEDNEDEDDAGDNKEEEEREEEDENIELFRLCRRENALYTVDVVVGGGGM